MYSTIHAFQQMQIINVVVIIINLLYNYIIMPE